MKKVVQNHGHISSQLEAVDKSGLNTVVGYITVKILIHRFWLCKLYWIGMFKFMYLTIY